MYHNYGLFNEKHLFLKFNGLSSAYLANKKKADDLDFHFSRFCEEFLFKADLMYSNLDKMIQINKLITQQAVELRKTSLFKREKNPGCPELIFPERYLLQFNTTFVNEFLGNVPPFLNTLFVLQDRILLIVGIFLGISDEIPNKLSLFYNSKVGRWNPLLKKYV